MKKNNSKQKKQNKNLTKPREEKKDKNLYFSTSMDWELHSFLTVEIQENLWSNNYNTINCYNTVLGTYIIIVVLSFSVLYIVVLCIVL